MDPVLGATGQRQLAGVCVVNEVTDNPLLTPHSFDGGRPDIWGRKCRLCGCTSAHRLHEPLAAGRDPGDGDRG